MQVLIVDDDDFALNVLEHTLSRVGYTAVSAHEGREAMDILRRGEIRVVITDWDMPGMNGLDLVRATRQEELSGYVYIIMLTAREGARQRMEGLCAGADDFLNKPLDPEELLICLKQAERILALETRDLALFAMAKLAESRDSETGAHIERVQCYTRLVAKNLSDEVKACHGVDDQYIRLLYQTSPLHDLGKVSIPDSILLKPGKLSAAEFAIMQTHTLVGAKTLDAALERFPNARFLQVAREIAASHHEKFDGSGYPHGLAGQQIPLCGRIVAIADVYDALTSRRIYKEPMSHEEAKAIVLRDSGSHFDPEVTDAFLRAEPEILAVRARFRDSVQTIPSIATVAASLPREPAGPAPCKILIVEDDQILLDKLTELLSATGEPVFKAADGEAGLKLWRKEGPRVVVSDWVMPKYDGVELCRQIRIESRGEPAHFIMLTAYSDRTRLLDAYQAGVDDFVGKPFDAEELLARVRAGIRTAKIHDELVRRAAGSQALNAQLATVNSRLERLAITDELTGVFNRRHAMVRLEEQWQLAQRYSRPLSIASIDIDHFKRINDTRGHHAGDLILRQVAEILRECTRGTDAVCRVGGEEFLILFPAQSIPEARICAERCRAAVEAHAFNIGDTTAKATISVGIAIRTQGMTQFSELLKVADQVMYAAKHSGRNVVRTCEDPAPADLWCELPQPGAKKSEPTAPQKPPVDLQVVLKRCGGDADFANAVTERFHSQAITEVDRIQQALIEVNASALSRAAHTVKSMAAYMAADSATNLAKQIEDLGRKNELAQVEPLLATLRQEVQTAITWLSKNVATIAAKSAPV